MREIKFRAWDRKNKEMWFTTHGDLARCSDGSFEWSPFVLEITSDFEPPFDVPNTGDLELMQYTGLKDQNGKEIYEGDIVKYSDEDVGLIEWGKYGWFVTHWNEFLGNFPTPFEETLEVTGNIYENPELLEEDVADES